MTQLERSEVVLAKVVDLGYTMHAQVTKCLHPLEEPKDVS